MSTALTEQQWDTILDDLEKWSEAYDQGRIDDALTIGQSITHPPEVLKTMKEVFGKDYLVENGFNLRLANEAFGEGWLDEP